MKEQEYPMYDKDGLKASVAIAMLPFVILLAFAIMMGLLQHHWPIVRWAFAGAGCIAMGAGFMWLGFRYSTLAINDEGVEGRCLSVRERFAWDEIESVELYEHRRSFFNRYEALLVVRSAIPATHKFPKIAATGNMDDMSEILAVLRQRIPEKIVEGVKRR